jgi:hypothetical protein
MNDGSAGIVPMRNLTKHIRYGPRYQRWDYFWGLGVEHETYLATSQRRRVTALEGAALKPERYSVNYYTNYRPDVLGGALRAVSGSGLIVPVLVNGHSFTHCDVFGEHATTFDRVPQPNPRFSGKRMWDWVCEHSVWLRDELDRSYQFDGDTIEFITQNFYRATVDSVLEELEATETRFIEEMGRLPRAGILTAYAPMTLAAPRNEPWATYLTAPRSVSMFNNGTVHVNVTLPTRLGWDRRPLWPRHFLEEHRCLARLIQWMEPLWVARFGSGDPFAAAGVDVSGRRFAAGSQRLAVSRYVGLGTFDTETMVAGKILQVSRTVAGPLPWYDWLAERTGYTRLDYVGLDLNYNKHWSHGLEIRLFDQMPVAALRTVLEEIVVLCDVARTRVAAGRMMPNPRRSAAWQVAAGAAILEGEGWRVEPEFVNEFCEGAVPGLKEPMTVADAQRIVMDALRAGSGDRYCQRVMMGGAVPAVSGGGCSCRT